VALVQASEDPLAPTLVQQVYALQEFLILHCHAFQKLHSEEVDETQRHNGHMSCDLGTNDG